MQNCLKKTQDSALLEQLHSSCFINKTWDFKRLVQQDHIHAYSINENKGLLVVQDISPQLEILTLGVFPEYRRQGIAKKSLAEMHPLYPNHTAWLLEVASQNHAAIALYKSFGFVTTSQRKAYYSNGDDALLMTLNKL